MTSAIYVEVCLSLCSMLNSLSDKITKSTKQEICNKALIYLVADLDVYSLA